MKKKWDNSHLIKIEISPSEENPLNLNTRIFVTDRQINAKMKEKNFKNSVCVWLGPKKSLRVSESGSRLKKNKLPTEIEKKMEEKTARSRKRNLS